MLKSIFAVLIVLLLVGESNSSDQSGYIFGVYSGVGNGVADSNVSISINPGNPVEWLKGSPTASIAKITVTNTSNGRSVGYDRGGNLVKINRFRFQIRGYNGVWDPPVIMEVDRYWSEHVMYKTDEGWEMNSFVRGSWSSQALSRVEPTSGEWWNIYYLTEVCSKPSTRCTFELEYTVIPPEDYYEVDELFSIRDSLLSVNEGLQKQNRLLAEGDLNTDGMVNIADFLIFVRNFGKIFNF